MSGFDFSMVWGRILASTPVLLVMFGGIALCVMRETRPLRVRVLVGIAIAIQMFNVVVMPIASMILISAAQQGGGGISISAQMMMLSVFASSVSGVSLALVLWAAFTQDDLPAA